MTREDAEGTTDTAACRFWMVSLTVTRNPFCRTDMLAYVVNSGVAWPVDHTQSPVALAMSSPTFFGDRPRGPILGARAEEAPTSPPVALK